MIFFCLLITFGFPFWYLILPRECGHKHGGVSIFAGKNALKCVSNKINWSYKRLDIGLVRELLIRSYGLLIPDYLPVQLGFRIPIVIGFRIPWAVLRIPKPSIPDSKRKKFRDFGFHKQNFLGFQNPDFLTWGEIGEHLWGVCIFIDNFSPDWKAR